MSSQALINTNCSSNLKEIVLNVGWGAGPSQGDAKSNKEACEGHSHGGVVILHKLPVEPTEAKPGAIWASI